MGTSWVDHPPLSGRPQVVGNSISSAPTTAHLNGDGFYGGISTPEFSGSLFGQAGQSGYIGLQGGASVGPHLGLCGYPTRTVSVTLVHVPPWWAVLFITPGFPATYPNK